ncbi:NAD(P)-dependent oxidoreductase [Pseudoduganella sp. LjRoot289]|uniref:NAD-dependent epimerase/dehydratase family protein n=1 Tax=Pseudoduganella sp. LjRoot289 TaxID=3342314 RepID=UPI003ECFE263
METLAILGASSQIAKDLIRSLVRDGQSSLLLYVRDCEAMRAWLAGEFAGQPHAPLRVAGYDEYDTVPHDAVLNFVGVGDPQRAAQMGGDIFAITQQFDDLALAGLRRHPQRRYLFLSSGAAYGSDFAAPASADMRATVAINALQPQDYYAVAKLHAECKHRALPDLAITDLRVFNYFSRAQDMAARFFITDMLRAIRDGSVLHTAPGFMVRDYLHPQDFHQLVRRVLDGPAANQALDCYSAAPIAKPELLALMQRRFGLRYEIGETLPGAIVNATGGKPHYYSLNRKAAELGYQPAFTSEKAITLESAIMLGRPAVLDQIMDAK